MGFTQVRRDMMRHFICDTVADIATIPTKYTPGSQLFCIEDGNRYVLNTSKEWSKVNSSCCGGSGSSSDTPSTPADEFMTNLEVDDLFD